jgi:hypothetical protein
MGLSAMDLRALDAHFPDEEIWGAVRAMPGNKSPSPDGFFWDFYRHCWSTIKHDVCAAVRAVFTGRDQNFRNLNTAYLTLLLKVEGAIELKQFRLISLVHSSPSLWRNC